MKRKINFLFTLFIMCNTLCFSEEIKYRVKQDLFCFDNESELPIKINKNSIITCEKNNYTEYYLPFFLTPDKEKSRINCTYNSYTFFINTEYIELINSEKIFTENDKEFLFIPEYYYEFINNTSLSFLLDKEAYWKKTKKKWDDGIISYYDRTFYDDYWLSYIYMNNLLFQIGEEWNGYIIYDVKHEKSTYMIDLFRSRSFMENTSYPDSFLKYSAQNQITLIFEFDGDYLDIWINNKNDYMGRYCKTTKETYEQIRKIVKSQKPDTTKIYWPRHADGTCDYEANGKSSSAKTVSTSSTTTAATNVAVNKTLTTNCNLKLRSGEATSTQVLTVMSTGTKVKILELGKAETIDGISSNWVKVEVLSGAKDRDGKEIKAGTVGWCYGGYLE